MSMGTQKGDASSSIRLQPQLTSPSPGLTPVSGAAGDISDIIAGVMTGLEELRRDMTKRIDQCLAESLAQATKESEEREVRMTREIERLLNDHDNTYAHTMTSLEKTLDAKSDLMMRKLDEILNRDNREECSAPSERSRQANDGDRACGHAGAQPSSRSNYESNHRERPKAAPSRPDWTNPVPPEADTPPPPPPPRGDPIAHCATSQISARSDYSLAGHNDVCLKV